MYSADWSKYLYLKEIKLSELWKNKEYLTEKDYDEWYIQTKSAEFDTKYTNIIDDIKYKIDIPKNIEEVFGVRAVINEMQVDGETIKNIIPLYVTGKK